MDANTDWFEIAMRREIVRTSWSAKEELVRRHGLMTLDDIRGRHVEIKIVSPLFED